MEIQPLQTDIPLGESLPVPFWAVTVQRPMRQFSTALGLRPGVPGIPSMEVAATILFGKTSFKAVIRRELGDIHFRNLNNYAMGRVRSPRTLRSILARCGGNAELLEMLVHALKAPEAGPGWKMSTVIEGAIYRSVSSIRRQQVPCPCCGTKLSVASADWWELQACHVGIPEAAFIDRVCMAAVGMHFLVCLRGGAQLRKTPSLLKLAEPHQHPNKNWLDLLMPVFGASSLSHLAARAGASLTSDTILRCSRGEMLTDHAVNELTSDLETGNAIRESVTSVRTLALAIEFLHASNRSDSISNQQAREIVAARVQRILGEITVVQDHFLTVSRSSGGLRQ